MSDYGSDQARYGSQYGRDYGQRQGGYREQRRYPDEGYYGASDDMRDRDDRMGGYYDRDYGQDFGEYRRAGEHKGGEQGWRDGGHDYRHYADEAREWAGTTAGIGTGAAILAVAAFGIGFLVGSRWHAESNERIWRMRRAPTLDDYHGHVSLNDPDAEAGTPPDADEVVGHEASGKSARESAETLRNAEGQRAERRETAAAGENGGKRKS